MTHRHSLWAELRDPRRTTQRAVGRAPFVAQYTPRQGRRRIVPVPPQIQILGDQKVSGTFSTVMRLRIAESGAIA